MKTDLIKKFAISILKLACGLALSALILGLAVWGIVEFRERADAAANESLSTPRAWPQITVTSLSNSTFHLQSVWRNGRAYYQFEMKGDPLTVRLAKEGDSQAAFAIIFLDKDGFKLFEHRLPLTEVAVVLGTDGEPVGVSWKEDESLGADLYRRFARWEISRYGFPLPQVVTVPKPSAKSITPNRPMSTAPAETTPRPKWKELVFWRILSRGISKKEVEEILGEPGKITEMSFQTIWHYNYPYGGQVTFGQDGKVTSWTEP